MRTSWACAVGWHGWRQLPGEPGGVTRQCERCGVQERVDWVYAGPGTGLGRVRSTAPAATYDSQLAA